MKHVTESIDPHTLQAWMHDGEELALFDVREQGQYGSAHPFFAAPLPYSRLEIEVPRLAPRRSVRIVLIDDDESIARKAAERLGLLGYDQLSVLRGGVGAWGKAGYPLFAGVHVPSKAFGEVAEHAYGTPSVSARELARMLDQGEDIIVIDGRPITEYRKMNIPGAHCCPNGELPFRVHRLVESEKTRVVVNCAGRTRSIIGAQTLINLGLANPVFALENGTQGWSLEGLALEHGGTRQYPPIDGTVHDNGIHPMRASAEALARRFKVPRVAAGTVHEWLGSMARTTYLFDVRTPEEYGTATIPGARNAPGGQLLQATDLYIGVRRARVVLFDNDDVRALVVASWLRQMGHDAWVLEGGISSGLQPLGPASHLIAAPKLKTISPAELVHLLEEASVAPVDLRASMGYRLGHIPGSIWSIRPRLLSSLAGETRPLVLIADAADVAQIAVTELSPFQQQQAMLLGGGFAAWRASGYPVIETPDDPPDEDCIDYLFFVHDRHAGNMEAARQYLAWEIGLIAKLHPQDRAVFHLPSSDEARRH